MLIAVIFSAVPIVRGLSLRRLSETVGSAQRDSRLRQPQTSGRRDATLD